MTDLQAQYEIHSAVVRAMPAVYMFGAMFAWILIRKVFK